MKEYAPKAEATEMDPRRKDSQGLDFWASSLLENGLIGRTEYEDFIRKNNSKEEVMEEMQLPQLRHYGLFSSVEDIRERIRPKEDAKFIIRCTSKENGDIKRLVDATLDEACAFADKLPGGFEQWEVEMKEFVITKAAGTIIISPNGKTLIESWKGPHYLNTTNAPKYIAEFDPAQFHQRYHWQVPNDAANPEEIEEMKGYALRALKHFFPHLKPKPNEPVYAEYGIRDSGEVYFLDANDSPLLTGK